MPRRTPLTLTTPSSQPTRSTAATSSTPATAHTPATPSTPPTPGTPPTPETAAIARLRPMALATSSGLAAGGAMARLPGPATGDDILALARPHLGERYVFGARAPMADGGWHGPWDCAEFASWCVYQASGVLYGVEPRHDPILADAFTGYWAQHARADGAMIAIEDAARIPGACLLRIPTSDRVGHIALSDGAGGTIEAHSTNTGVIQHRVSGRRWDGGVLVPGVRYFMADETVEVVQPMEILRLTHPMMRGPRVRAVQEALLNRGFSPSVIDGVYGPQTESAVQSFQLVHGLVPDGEVGDLTWRALGLA